MEFTRGTADDIEKLAFLSHLGIASDESAKGVEMRLDAESARRRERGKFFGFDVAQLVNPVVELGLLLGRKFEEEAIGAGLHKVRGKG